MTAESPEMLDDRDPEAVVQALELHLGADEPDWSRVADGAAFLQSYALQQRGGTDD
jgi:hypothetical protein